MQSNEEYLLQCTNEGRWFELGDVIPLKAPEKILDADFIRALLIGSRDGQDLRRYPLGVRIRGAFIVGRIDLREARSADMGPLPPLLLEHCVLSGNADEPTDAVLIARHGHLSRLALTGCQIGRVDLSDARLDGDLTIDCVKPIACVELEKTKRRCQLTARGAEIHGRINARGSTFAIPLDAYIPDFDIVDYAFDLNDARVNGSIYLCPKFEAVGGVNLMEARVEGSIWCAGAHLVAGAGAAFRAQSLLCSGVVSFNRRSKSDVTKIEGEVEFKGAEIGGLQMDDILFAPGPTKLSAPPSIVISDTKVRNSVSIEGTSLLDTGSTHEISIFAHSISVGHRFAVLETPGSLTAPNAEIGSDMELSSCVLKQIFLGGARIQGSLYIRATQPNSGETSTQRSESPRAESSTESAGVMTPRHTDRREDTPTEKEQPYISGPKLSVRGTVEVEAFQGTVTITNAEIGGSFILNAVEHFRLYAQGADVKGAVEVSSNEKALSSIFSAPNLKVGEDLKLRLTPCSIELEGSRIQNDMDINFPALSSKTLDFSFVNANNVSVSNNCVILNVSGRLSLNSAHIGSRLEISAASLASLEARNVVVQGPVELTGSLAVKRDGKASFEGGQFGGRVHLNSLWFLQAPNTKPFLSLEDANIERDLHVTSMKVSYKLADAWAFFRPTQVCIGELTFYPGWHLYEAKYVFPAEGTAIIAFLRKINGSEQLILLSGSSAPIHQINKSGALKIEQPQDVALYLRFFCNYVWGDLGRFRIIESQLELDDAVERASFDDNASFSAFSVLKSSEGSWECRATVAYDGSISDCHFTVSPNGTVAMLNDEKIGKLLEQNAPLAMPPLRLFGATKSKRGGDGDSTNRAEERSSDTRAVCRASLFWVGETASTPKIVDPPIEYYDLLLRLAGVENHVEHQKPSATVSLKGLKAGAVKFHSTQAWGPGILVHLMDFEYGRLEEDDEEVKDVFTDATQATWTNYASDARKTSRTHPESARKIARKRNCDWLSLQFPERDPRKHPKGAEFSQQPHEHLTRILRAQGETDQAIEVRLHQLKLERIIMLGPISCALSRFMFAFSRHGLRPGWGIFWCFIALLLGGVYFDYLNYGEMRWLPQSRTWGWHSEEPILVIDSAAVSPLISPEHGDFGNPTMEFLPANDKRSAPEFRCGEQVDPILYPIDVFVPLLNLRQQDKCTISTHPSAFIHRLIKFLYTVVGSIFTSLTLLSVAGVLRRRIEQ